MYKHGVKLNDMRISNVHHETAIQSLLLVQEIEPDTWEKICNRIDGANTIKHIKFNSFRCPSELPYMFDSWKEYALHLAKNIIQDNSNRELLYSKIKSKEDFYSGRLIVDDFWKTIVKTVLSSDWDFTKLVNWETAQPVFCYRRFKSGKRNKEILMYPKYLENEEIREILAESDNSI
jgi:predicted phosphoadenosine phosphosulfate sulfurtransferase